MSTKGVFWTVAGMHCVATFIVVLTGMGWTMLLLDRGHTEAPAMLQILSALQMVLVWPVLYPLARVMLSLGYGDPLAPVYWLLPPVNSGVVGFLAAGMHGWVRHRR